MYDQFVAEIDKMLDGDRPDSSVLVKYQRTLNGKTAQWVVMGEIAKRAAERGSKRKAK